MPSKGLARLGVKEVTVFKDGHAFVLHSGKMPTDGEGNVVMDYLPTPVMGAFWPFSTDRRAKLSAVAASQRKVLLERTALDPRQLIQANAGAHVIITETASGSSPAPSYAATILEVPARSGEEQEATGAPNSGEKLRQDSSFVLLRTEQGVKVVALDRIQDVTFTGDYRKSVMQEEFRNLLTLKMDWEGGRPQSQADVGLLYLQRGIRWIPNYKVTIDGKGHATVRLQATLINELVDLEDVTAHLVVGVPNFEFKDTPDPISLQQTVAQLSQYFRPDTRTAYAFSNAIMSQAVQTPTASNRADAPEGGHTLDLGPDVAGSGKSEDMFVFTMDHISIRKGQRMAVTIGEFAMKYQDVLTLDIPSVPPAELLRNVDSSRQTELARLLNAPKVMHKIRLFNSSQYPLTTAPALLLKDDRLLAQGLMTYSAPGASADLNITSAMDIRFSKEDNETKRAPNDVVWQGEQYGRIDLAGKITLTSFRPDAVEVEVTRNLFGTVDSTDNGGHKDTINILEDNGAGGSYSGWSWLAGPWWWQRVNGAGRVTWTVKLEPKKPLDLGYKWHYYWR
jgi:hypothetical protein